VRVENRHDRQLHLEHRSILAKAAHLALDLAGFRALERGIMAFVAIIGVSYAFEVFLVHPDGTRQLVRGAVFDELDTRSLRSDILAAGDDPYVDNTLGAIPTTTIAPSLLFDDIGVKRATAAQQRLPYYPPPPTQ